MNVLLNLRKLICEYIHTSCNKYPLPLPLVKARVVFIVSVPLGSVDVRVIKHSTLHLFRGDARAI